MNNSNNSSQSLVMLVGRICMGAIFLVAGLRKSMAIAGTAGYMTKFGIPAADLLVYAVIALEVLGGLALIIGFKTKIVAWALAIFVVPMLFTFHAFWNFPPEQYANQLNHFLKNLAIIGGLLYTAVFGAGAMSVDKR